MSGKSTRTPEERFRSKVTEGEPDECWPWQAASRSGGYGVFLGSKGKLVGAHRFAWEMANGSVPDGLWVLHHCDNPPCCNPRHLWLGTQHDNANDMHAKGRHPITFDPSCPARGDKNGSKLHPESVPRGVRSGGHIGANNRRGSRNGSTHLLESDIVIIRQRIQSGDTRVSIARDYNVDRMSIWRIENGRSWNHVPLANEERGAEKG